MTFLEAIRRLQVALAATADAGQQRRLTVALGELAARELAARGAGAAVGLDLPSNVQRNAVRLAYDVKSLDAWVDGQRTALGEATFLAWKHWAQGTVDGVKRFLAEADWRYSLVLLPVAGPVGAAAAAATILANVALQDDRIAEEYRQLNTWRASFRAGGATPPGPDPEPPVSLSDRAIAAAAKAAGGALATGAVVLGTVALGVLVVSRLLEWAPRQLAGAKR